MPSRALSLRPVNSVKHIVDTNGLIITSAVSTTDVSVAVDAPVVNSNQVHVGSSVKWFFLSVEVVGDTSFANAPRVYMYVVKNPSNELTLPSPGVVGTSSVRKFIFHQEMKMVGNTTAFPRTMFKGVIRVPKRYQRQGIEDKLQVILGHDSGESSGRTSFCIQAIYKEFY